MAHARTAIAACCLTLGAVGLVSALAKPGTPPQPVVQTNVLDGVSAGDAVLLRQFFGAVADIVERDGKSQTPVLKTTFDLRHRYTHALQLAVQQTNMVGKYPELGKRLDVYMVQALGSTDDALTAESRAKIAAGLRAIR